MYASTLKKFDRNLVLFSVLLFVQLFSIFLTLVVPLIIYINPVSGCTFISTVQQILKCPIVLSASKSPSRSLYMAQVCAVRHQQLLKTSAYCSYLCFYAFKHSLSLPAAVSYCDGFVSILFLAPVITKTRKSQIWHLFAKAVTLLKH